MRSSTILLVSPSLDFLLLMRHIVETDGFVVGLAQNSDDAMEQVRVAMPLAVVVECRQATTIGQDLCDRLKGDPATAGIAVIPLVEQGAEPLYIGLIQAGADRLFHRPFDPIELLEYLHSLTKTSERPAHQTVLKSSGIELDIAGRRVKLGGAPVELGMLEFNLLQLFMENPRTVFRRHELVARGWPSNTHVDDRTVDVRIGLLRKALKRQDGRDVIRTVRGVGYAFDGDFQD